MSEAAIEFSCCTIPQLPPIPRAAAAWYAAIARPSNAPGLIDLVYGHPADQPLPPESISLLKGKFWPNGSKLSVAFKGGNTDVNAKVLQYASMWSKWANIDFVGVNPTSQWDILVGYDQPGYWSYIGTDSRFASRQGEQSLNLQGFDSQPMPDSEWSRVVCHEVGHALGALHEQQRPEAVARLDREACYRYFGQTQGWSREEIDQQILTPMDMSQVLASTEDDTSVMMYSFPGKLTIDHKPIVGGAKINELDGQTMARAYPGRGAPHPEIDDLLRKIIASM